MDSLEILDVTIQNARQRGSLEGLIRRMEMPRKAPELVFEFTRDEGYLHQYFLLRGELLSRSYNWGDYTGEREPLDDVSHILVVRRGNQVVGGARLTPRSPRKHVPFVLEHGQMSLIEALPEYKLAYTKHCELGRMALIEEFQNKRISFEMFRRLHEKAASLNIRYGFSSVSARSARLFQLMSSHYGFSITDLGHVAIPSRIENGEKLRLVMMESFVHSKGNAVASVAQEENA